MLVFPNMKKWQKQTLFFMKFQKIKWAFILVYLECYLEWTVKAFSVTVICHFLVLV